MSIAAYSTVLGSSIIRPNDPDPIIVQTIGSEITAFILENTEQIFDSNHFGTYGNREVVEIDGLVQFQDSIQGRNQSDMEFLDYSIHIEADGKYAETSDLVDLQHLDAEINQKEAAAQQIQDLVSRVDEIMSTITEQPTPEQIDELRDLRQSLELISV